MGPTTDALTKEQIEARIGQTRETITFTLDELDRRRREAFDLRLQARRHPVAVLATVSVLVALVALGAWSVNRALRPDPRLRRARDGLLRAYHHPELLAQPGPTFGRRVAGSALAAAATVAAKQLTRRALERL